MPRISRCCPLWTLRQRTEWLRRWPLRAPGRRHGTQVVGPLRGHVHLALRRRSPPEHWQRRDGRGADMNGPNGSGSPPTAPSSTSRRPTPSASGGGTSPHQVRSPADGLSPGPAERTTCGDPAGPGRAKFMDVRRSRARASGRSGATEASGGAPDQSARASPLARPPRQSRPHPRQPPAVRANEPQRPQHRCAARRNMCVFPHEGTAGERQIQMISM